MRSLTLKDVPDALLERLRVLAAAERRSLSQQALVLIEEGGARRPLRERSARWTRGGRWPGCGRRIRTWTPR